MFEYSAFTQGFLALFDGGQELLFVSDIRAERFGDESRLGATRGTSQALKCGIEISIYPGGDR